jgi:membrane protease YdiL (CAAX protease family)
MSFASDPPPSEPNGRAIRPMPVIAASGWVLGATFILALLGTLTSDIVGSFACQAIAYLLVVFSILRVYAPNASMRAFLALRRTHVAFYPIAILLGAAIEIPALAVLDLVQRRYPTENSHDPTFDLLTTGAMPKRILAGLIIVVLGPFLEEIFFRGALFKPLERHYAASRSIVIGLTAVLFAFAHVDPQAMIHLAIVGLALGFLRQASGSIVPSALLHATFNAIPFYAVVTAKPGSAELEIDLPRWLVAVGCAATVLLLVLAKLVSTRTEAASRAQELDQQ